ncbi:MAG: DNA repair protein RecN [Xenococcus sp. (in: cyanobacteria)]
MLVSLRINNFALIDTLELQFNQGLNVLTGETGAGKSIILDAIDAALGGKLNSASIRTGSDRATIEASFTLNSALETWLGQQQIELLEEDNLVCSRELSVTKGKLRSRSRINGVLANRQLMAQLRSQLVEITAQGQTIDLLISERQRELLDLYAGRSVIQQKQKVVKAYENCQEAKSKLEQRRKSQQERLQRQDFLGYQLKELEESNLTRADELENLEQESDRLSHIVELQEFSYQVYQLLYQNDRDAAAASDLVGKAETALQSMTEYDSALTTILEMVQSGLTQIVEAAQQINSYGDRLEADPERLEEIEARIRQLKNICRKYGPELVNAIALQEQLATELAELTNSEQSIAALEQEYQLSQDKLQQVCTKLTQLRHQAASKLEKQLVKELKPLAMDKVIFESRLISCNPTINGADKVVFYFSPNPGEAIQPLATTASGGEMSRFLLALKACFVNTQMTSHTSIFDEIDAGVSGKVAQAIAEKLYQLSQKHQVLCVTHQPLVAAMANAHYKVSKTIVEEKTEQQRNGDSHLPDIRTVVRVNSLSDRDSIIKELAQITGGHAANDAIAFAESLLTKAAKYQEKIQD